ncbi:hypothetical protein [uncultured Roseobacter sp.]|uniref:hypothetical protein n=1 Tax=uncultured Roseobacter sp. TaxID=114847 RepID=UPI0026323B2B|nr:hypothetical protein [uncultured Roseobacter sp.]
MAIRKRKNFNLQLLLTRLSNVRTLNADGSMSISGFGVLDDYESYLRTAVIANGKSDAFMREVVSKAIRQEQNLTEDSFVKHCNRIANRMEQMDRKSYKVLFPVWGSRGLISGRRKWGDVSVSFDISQATPFARRASKDRAEQLRKRDNNTSKVMHDLQDLPLASCSVDAVSVHDAFEKAEEAISKEIGLYSLISSRGKFVMTSEPDKPINTILLAPHMTVHDASGAISADIYWYNRWADHLTEKTRKPEDVARIKQQVKSVRLRLRKLPWREKAELALARHYAAFAQCDLESSFLDGWRLLEAIGGHSREKGEALVKRAAWFFENRDEQYQIGLHLMHRRNLISHGRPMKEDNHEGLAFQMKQFVTPFLHAYLTNPFKFQDLEEFWGFCDLPVDKHQRSRKAYVLECSTKFRQES